TCHMSRACVTLSCADATTSPIHTLALHYALPISHHIARVYLIPPPHDPLVSRLVDHFGVSHVGGEKQQIHAPPVDARRRRDRRRSEEHTSELRHVKNSYAVFCLKTKTRYKVTLY